MGESASCKAERHKYKSLPQVDDERPCDVYNMQNLAIAMSYFSVGVVMSFMATPLNVYLVEKLRAEPPVQNTIAILQTLPWSLKLLFGFLSDSFPIFGMHRKPYLTIGALLYSSVFLLYAFLQRDSIVLLSTCTFFGTLGIIQMDVMADAMCVERSKFEHEDQKGQMQASFYSIRFAGSLIGAILGTVVCNQATWGWGLTFFQVAAVNGLVPFLLVTPWLYVLKEKYRKRGHPSGDIQTWVELDNLERSGKEYPQYNQNETVAILSKSGKLKPPPTYSSTAATQLVTASPASAAASPATRAKRLAMRKAQASPLVYTDPASMGSDTDDPMFDIEDEMEDDHTRTIQAQLIEIWLTVQLKAVWRPMCFVFLFNMFQVPNVAWQSFLQLGLNFEPWILGLTVIIGSFMTFAGVLAYKTCFFRASWRSIYVWSVALTSFFSLLQLMLIFQVNRKYLHLSNYLFSLGDDVITAYISGIQFLPVCIMYMRLCPEGAEGATYAMLTTFGNIAMVCASNLGNLAAGIWDVSNAAMERHDYSGLWRLSVLTSVLAVLPLGLLFLLPRNAEEQDQLAKSPERSKVAGGMFLTVLFGSLLWSTCTAISRLAHNV